MNNNRNGSTKVPNATNIESKGCQTRPTLNQKGANMSNSCSKIKPWVVRVFSPFTFIFRQNWKNCHGALVGLTCVNGTSVEKIILLFEKVGKYFLALVGLIK